MRRNHDNPRILAVASGGGHWVQLLRVRDAFAGLDVAFVSTNPGYRGQVGEHRFYTVRDANRWNKIGVLLLATQMALIVLRERPGCVVSTGAAPGYLAIRFARFLGARTIWIDSIANAQELSMSGRMAANLADVCLTQWPHLAEESGPFYIGAVV